MDQLDALEFIDMIDEEYIQESYEAHERGGGTNIIRVRWWHYAGMAACLAISLLSGGLLVLGGMSGGSEVSGSGDLATAAGQNGSILVGVLILGLVAAGAFLYLIIRKKREK
ncbi:MAG: hypothetical protein IKQ97_05720 [Eubacterium sp.]|nr:hypothetical protein [Eubacterium sp.]